MKGNGFVFELNEEMFGVTEEQVQDMEKVLPQIGPGDTELGEANDEVKALAVLSRKKGEELKDVIKQQKEHEAKPIHDEKECEELSKQLREKDDLYALYSGIKWESVRRSLGIRNDRSLGLRRGWKVVSFVSPEEKLAVSLENFSNLFGKNLSEAAALRKMFD